MPWYDSLAGFWLIVLPSRLVTSGVNPHRVASWTRDWRSVNCEAVGVACGLGGAATQWTLPFLKTAFSVPSTTPSRLMTSPRLKRPLSCWNSAWATGARSGSCRSAGGVNGPPLRSWRASSPSQRGRKERSADRGRSDVMSGTLSSRARTSNFPFTQAIGKIAPAGHEKGRKGNRRNGGEAKVPATDCHVAVILAVTAGSASAPWPGGCALAGGVTARLPALSRFLRKESNSGQE